MYNEELDLLIAKFCQSHGTRWPFLRHAVKKLYDTYYKLNRIRPNPPQQERDGEWIDVGYDVDQEVHFMVNDNPEDFVPHSQLNDTLPYNQSPRQYDECQDQQVVEEQQSQQPTDGDNETYVKQYADDVEKVDYDNYYDYDSFDNTYYLATDHWDIGQFDDQDCVENQFEQVDSKVDSQSHRYVMHIQDSYTEEKQIILIKDYYDEDLTGFNDTIAQEQVIDPSNAFTVAETTTAPTPQLCEIYMHSM